MRPYLLKIQTISMFFQLSKLEVGKLNALFNCNDSELRHSR